MQALLETTSHMYNSVQNGTPNAIWVIICHMTHMSGQLVDPLASFGGSLEGLRSMGLEMWLQTTQQTIINDSSYISHVGWLCFVSPSLQYCYKECV